MIRQFGIILLFLMATVTAFAQCNVLRQLRSVDFITSGECAPVDVTKFTITYTFSISQNPLEIEILFYWNDPANTIETLGFGDPTFIVSDLDRKYEATATFSYPQDDNCLFTPQAYIQVAGTRCETSLQEQFVSAWDRDDNFGGDIIIDPNPYSVCFGTAISSAVFTDNSTFNCNATQNPDNPNELERHVQFVYGNAANHVAANAIKNLSLLDGGTQSLTDGTGALSSTLTRGTAGLQITAAHFGEVVAVPFPAQASNAQSLPISAPANAANAIGNTFEVTLFNWNTCNPYNGDPVNPNYEDAVFETATITVVAPPNPSYQTLKGTTPQTTFCLGDDITFNNLTVGAYTYTWEFYDDALGTTLLSTSNAVSPTYAYNTSGQKLIRLIATDGSVQGTCEVSYEDFVTLSPAAIAGLELYDATFSTLTNAEYCQDGSSTFTVGFRDATVGIETETRFRMEFYDEAGNLLESIPTGIGTYTPTNTPFTDFTRDYSTVESTIVKLIARNNTTQCESVAMDTIAVYPQPTATFTTSAACEGTRTLFSAIADSITSLTPRVNGDRVILYEWDLSYDGVSFQPEVSRLNDQDFSWFLDGVDIALNTEQTVSVAGTYRVALRMTTERAGCIGFIDQDVTVYPLPEATFTSDYSSAICPGESIHFQNTSSNSGLTMTYALTIQHAPSGFLNVINLMRSDSLIAFTNPNDTTRTYRIRLKSTTSDGCETTSPDQLIEVFPDENAGFDDPSFDFRVTNCSPWSSTFLIDQATRNLNADQYSWTLLDGTGTVNGYPVLKTSGDPAFQELDYDINNTTGAIVNYRMVLEASKTGTCIANDTFNIQISPQPDATFQVVQEDDCMEVVFQLEASQKGLTNYQWDFDPTPTSIFDDDDLQMLTYSRESNTGNDFAVTISLITQNLANCQSEEVIQFFTVDKMEPDIIADFTISEDTIQLPINSINIQNNSSTGTGFTYQWDFGDASTSTDEQPGSHSYTKFGAYEIELIVTSGYCEEVITDRLVVLPADPIIDFEADVLEGCSPLTVQFTNLSQFTESGQFIWEFGDGSISRQDHPTYTYYQDGLFAVRLRGENEVGTVAETEKTEYIEVFGLPYADFLASPRVVYIPTQQVFFSNLSRNGVTYLWDFGDGQTSNEENPRHSYADEGLFDITLIAENGFGCVDTLFRDTEIRAVKGGDVSAPNAFTPDTSGPSGGDITAGGNSDPSRINDIFLPRLEGVTKFRMLIYNKWGQLLFESNSQNVGWDGYFNGRLAPAGVYLYKLELKYSSGQDFVKVGDLTLIR